MADKTRASECVVCGAPIEQKQFGRPRSKCSKRCRDLIYFDKQKRDRRSANPELYTIRGCINCGDSFYAAGIRQKFCSHKCRVTFAADLKRRSGIDRSAVFFSYCPDCHILMVLRAHGGINSKPCKDCRRRRNSLINARKIHVRRAAGQLTLSVFDLADRDGSFCNICKKKINMDLPGSHKWGPTIDHLLPVSMGGSNEPGNLALAHRQCNTVRGNRGAVQLLLEDYRAGSAAEA